MRNKAIIKHKSVFGTKPPLDNCTLIATHEVGESIELIYIQTSTTIQTVYPPRPPARNVFKIVFSCQDGKWHKSEPIFGEIIPSVEEQYTF